MQPMSLHKRASWLRIGVVERDLRVRKRRFENHVRARRQPAIAASPFCLSGCVCLSFACGHSPAEVPALATSRKSFDYLQSVGLAQGWSASPSELRFVVVRTGSFRGLFLWNFRQSQVPTLL